MTKGQKAPRTRSFGLRQKAWWVMRRRPNFTLNDLLEVIATGTEKDANSNLLKYLRVLTETGYLMISEERKKGASLTSNGFYVYRLVRDTGMKPPVWRNSTKQVYDQNTGAVYDLGVKNA